MVQLVEAANGAGAVLPLKFVQSSSRPVVHRWNDLIVLGYSASSGYLSTAARLPTP